jgi:hypothetical protein
VKPSKKRKVGTNMTIVSKIVWKVSGTTCARKKRATRFRREGFGHSKNEDRGEFKVMQPIESKRGEDN